MCKNKILKLQFTTILGGIMFSRGNEHRETVWCLPGSLPQRKPGFPDHRITRHYFPHLQRAGEFKEEDFCCFEKKQWKQKRYFAWHQIYSCYHFGWWAKLVDIAYIYIYIHTYHTGLFSDDWHHIYNIWRMVGRNCEGQRSKHLRKISTCMYNIHSMYSRYVNIKVYIYIYTPSLETSFTRFPQKSKRLCWLEKIQFPLRNPFHILLIGLLYPTY